MIRPPALTATAKARRRSGLLRAAIPRSPRSTARKTATGASVPSRLAAPLPVTKTTGRHTTHGAIGGVTPASSTKCASRLDSTRMTTPRNPVIPRASLPATSSRVQQRQTAVPPSRMNGRVPPSTTVRPPSEAEKLKQKLAEVQKEMENMKKEAENQQCQAAMMREMNGMLKDSLEVANMKAEKMSMELTMNKDMLEATKQQLEATKETLENKESINKNLTAQLDEKEVVLRKLHNDVVDLRGQIRVVIRVRPMLKHEQECATAIEYAPGNSISVMQGSKPSGQFQFEKVFPPCASQEEVFQNIEDFILSALHGYNVGLIAFGQTGSGKTHTMRGGMAADEGVIPRAAGFLFREAKKLEATGWAFEFSLSFLEIYNNEAYDLLNKHSLIKVRILNGTVALDGLSEHKLDRIADLASLLRQADSHRRTAATKCNENSSRSHAVYMWKIKVRQESTGISTTSVLKLVDLAGSERAKESGVTGEQFNEMTAINKSLSVLQKCVSMQKSGAKHVPYRDVKLTQVLMDCLGAGHSKTMVIVNINPCDVQAQESKRSIEFAARMRDTHIGSAVQQRDL